jgi:rhamnogalacturonyl hydrolase YesR
MPADHPRRGDLIEMLRLNLEGLLRVQDRHGLWHNVLDASPADSRSCSSATSQFIRIYAGAYHKGWLKDARIPPMIEKAWLGLKTKIWDYRYLGYCVGTSYALSRQCYLSRPHDSFRPCRSGILHAWIEIQRMRAARN